MPFKKKLGKIKKICLQGKRGFTLVETLIAMLLFTLIVVMISGVFMTFLKNYVVVRNLQRSTESAQFAMNLMAKTIRTSQVAPQVDTAYIDLFDFSQSRCLRYTVTAANIITVAYTTDASPASITACTFNTLQTPQEITAPETNVGGFFSVQPSNSTALGLVKIVLTARAANQDTPALVIQTSVSLRNAGTL
jgi:Tfp pilus assembly protein PilV